MTSVDSQRSLLGVITQQRKLATFNHMLVVLSSFIAQIIVSLEIGFFDSNKTGDLMNRLSSDTTKLQDAATTNVSMFLRSLVSLVLSLVLLFVTSWSLTLVAMAVVPAIIIAATLYGRLMKKLSRRYQDEVIRCCII